jgi:pimeloyl-ACP methyl ester carboxylesterase
MSTQSVPDRFFERDGVRLRWRSDGAGPPLVLLHGWALDLEYWEPALPLLARQFTVLRFDRRGFGLSGGEPDIHCNVGDLLALLDHAGIGRAVLLGMSQGARLAIHCTCQQSRRVRALLLDGAPALDAEPELALSEFRALLASGGLAALQAAVLRHPLMHLQAGGEWRRAQLAAIVARYPGRDLLHPVARAEPPDLGSIKVPTLIFNGVLDTQTRLEAAGSLAISISGAQRRLLPGAGHLALLDDPAAYAEAVISFCRALPP